MQHEQYYDMLAVQKGLSEMFNRLSNEKLKGSDLQEELNRAIGLTELAKTSVANNIAIMKAAEMSGASINSLNLIPVEKNVMSVALPDGKRRGLLNRPAVDME